MNEAHEKVETAVHEHKSEGKYKSRKQAIAAGLNQAREAGGKVPPKKNSRKKMKQQTGSPGVSFKNRLARAEDLGTGPDHLSRDRTYPRNSQEGSS